MEFLASDALQGRGSATQFELIAALYIAAQLRQFGVEPAGDADANGQKTYLQTANFTPRNRNPNATTTATPQTKQTWNVVGTLQGSDLPLSKQVILLSAHLDHLGTRAATDNQATLDVIYNGADDDASGVVAVLELSRELSRNCKPKRTVMFAFFGAEEIGGHGARHFLDNPPLPLNNIIANLEFEMIGRPDTKVAAETLWLTGYERSTLGAALARHGARLVPDPRPDQNFFQRSDNYQLARRGIIAHTVSSFGLHKEYHQPNDDLAHIDFAHMTRAINSMRKPIEWLTNSNFTPAWVAGKKP